MSELSQQDLEICYILSRIFNYYTSYAEILGDINQNIESYKEGHFPQYAYLVGRPNLRRVFLLIDARHCIKKIDTEIMDMLDKAAVTYQVVLTKIDKISLSALERILEDTQKQLKEHTAAHVTILKTSSEKNLYLDELKYEIAELANS